jgi:hypothetical protein
MISKGVVTLLQHLKDLGDLGVSVGIKGDGVVTPQSAIRPCGREVPPRGPWTCLEVRT